MLNQVYLNGDYVALEDAKISVLDRGFLFSDSVYEVIPIYSGHFFRLEQHLERLKQSLNAIMLNHFMSEAEWLDIGKALLERNELTNATMYIQVTRGVSMQRAHQLSADYQPTVFAMVSPLPKVYDPLSPEYLENVGMSVITAEDIRWGRCDIKSTSLLANCLLLQQALDSGADDTILVRSGNAIEATSSNVFMVKSSQIFTPNLTSQVLPGVTRDFVIELCKEAGFEVIEAPINCESLAAADEIWLTSSSKEIRPVVALNGSSVGNGQPGEVCKQMMCAYQDLKKRLYQGDYQ